MVLRSLSTVFKGLIKAASFVVYDDGDFIYRQKEDAGTDGYQYFNCR